MAWTDLPVLDRRICGYCGWLAEAEAGRGSLPEVTGHPATSTCGGAWSTRKGCAFSPAPSDLRRRSGRSRTRRPGRIEGRRPRRPALRSSPPCSSPVWPPRAPSPHPGAGSPERAVTAEKGIPFFDLFGGGPQGEAWPSTRPRAAG
ncbi:MAG: hypothetical protein R3F43_22550 [bacterium]